MSPPLIDLDANSTTRPHSEVVEAVARAMTDCHGNPGSSHAFGRAARRLLEESRESIAHALGALPGEVIFTSGGTEANNLAVLGIPRGAVGEVWSTPGAHPSISGPLSRLAERGLEVHAWPVDADGQLLSEAVDATHWSRVRFVSVMLAHNETGVIQDVAQVAARCAEHGVPWHVDAVQAVGKMHVNFRQLDATSMSIAAHKLHGPRGIGALIVKTGLPLVRLMEGGHQEAGRRPGTESSAFAAGFARAVELWMRDVDQRRRALAELRDRLESILVARCAPVRVLGAAADRLPNTLNMRFIDADGEAVLLGLDLAGVAASLGSACASGSAEPSPIHLAMGMTSRESRETVRFSVSAMNTPAEIDQAVERIASVVARVRRQR